MPVPVAAIIARLEELDIQPILKDGNLILKAKPGSISEKCKTVVRENKAAIITYLSKLEPQTFEHKLSAIFRRGCTITEQPKGLSLQKYVSELQNSETRVSQKEKKPAWTETEWQAAEAVQYQKVREYQGKVGTPIPVEESYMGEDGYMIIPELRRLKIM
jgi:hypothetical protein